MTASRTWLITGCSTGLGRALAQAVLEHGDNVVATARDVTQLADLGNTAPDRCAATALDVNDGAQIADAVAVGEQRFGGIDVLVNNAGHGYRAAVEEGEETGFRALFETNFFGPVALIKAVLPRMRARHSGTIVNISSIAAAAPPVASGYYAASKAALEALTSSLRDELAPLGLSAFIVEPGGFRTDFSGRSLRGSDVAIGDYDATAGPRRVQNARGTATAPGDPAKAARAIITVVESPEPPLMLVLGPDAVSRFQNSLDARAADLQAWLPLSVSTDFA